MLFAGREVRIGKNCARGQTKGTVFSYTDRPRPVNNLFIFFCFSFQDDRRESVCEQSTRIASHCHSLVKFANQELPVVRKLQRKRLDQR